MIMLVSLRRRADALLAVHCRDHCHTLRRDRDGRRLVQAGANYLPRLPRAFTIPRCAHPRRGPPGGRHRVRGSHFPRSPIPTPLAHPAPPRFPRPTCEDGLAPMPPPRYNLPTTIPFPSASVLWSSPRHNFATSHVITSHHLFK